MGNRAIYTLIENGEPEHFYSPWGANALSPVLRLRQAQEIQEEIKKPLTHILAHLTYDGEYQNPVKNSDNLFLSAIAFDPSEPRKESGIEMYITLDLDQKMYTLDFNREYPPYMSMDKYQIPIEVGMKGLDKLLEYGEKNNKNSFGELLEIYNQMTGLSKAFAKSRADENFINLLNSPESEEMRAKYNRILEEESEKVEEDQEI